GSKPERPHPLGLRVEPARSGILRATRVRHRGSHRRRRQRGEGPRHQVCLAGSVIEAPTRMAALRPMLNRLGESLGCVWWHPLGKGRQYLQPDFGRAQQHCAEARIRDNKHSHWLGRSDGRSTRPVGNERYLTEEVARLDSRSLPAVAAYLGLPVDQDEELSAAIALARQNRAFRQVNLVRNGGNLRELRLPERGEERNLLDEGDLRVLARPERHRRSLLLVADLSRDFDLRRGPQRPQWDQLCGGCG